MRVKGDERRERGEGAERWVLLAACVRLLLVEAINEFNLEGTHGRVRLCFVLRVEVGQGAAKRSRAEGKLRTVFGMQHSRECLVDKRRECRY